MGLFLICIDRIKVEVQQPLTGLEPILCGQSIKVLLQMRRGQVRISAEHTDLWLSGLSCLFFSSLTKAGVF